MWLQRWRAKSRCSRVLSSEISSDQPTTEWSSTNNYLTWNPTIRSTTRIQSGVCLSHGLLHKRMTSHRMSEVTSTWIPWRWKKWYVSSCFFLLFPNVCTLGLTIAIRAWANQRAVKAQSKNQENAQVSSQESSWSGPLVPDNWGCAMKHTWGNTFPVHPVWAVETICMSSLSMCCDNLMFDRAWDPWQLKSKPKYSMAPW